MSPEYYQSAEYKDALARRDADRATDAQQILTRVLSKGVPKSGATCPKCHQQTMHDDPDEKHVVCMDCNRTFKYFPKKDSDAVWKEQKYAHVLDVARGGEVLLMKCEE